MFKHTLPFLLIILYTSTISAQDWNEIYYLESEAQYLIDEKQYEKAIDIYRRMLREEPNYSLAKFKIGQLYLLTDDQKHKALEFLEDASQDINLDFKEKALRETKAPAEALLYLGQAFQIANRIDDAESAYKKLKEMIKPDNRLYPAVVHRLQTCENAKTAMSHPLNVTKTNLGSPINNNDSNFGAVLSGDGNTLIYTSYTSNFLDNYYSEKENGSWSNPKRISEKLSSKYYLKTVSLSYDGNTLFLVTDDPENNNLFVCYKEGGEWTEAEKLPKTINGKKSNESHACISKDGKTLYFTSNRAGGLGGTDLYKSTLDAKGSWGEAENLGQTINTEFDEATPFIILDDKYLFFSSQGHNSIGGFDIFYADLTSTSSAINLGYPANSTDDDLFFVPDNSLTSGYISQYDESSLGLKDIYYIQIISKIIFSAQIKNKTNGEKITDAQLKISILESDTKSVLDSFITNKGELQSELNPGNYSILIENEKYDPYTNQIVIPSNYAEKTFSFEALLNPKPVEQEELLAEVIEQEDVVAEVEAAVSVPALVEEEISTPPIEEIKEEEPAIIETPENEELEEVQVEEKIPEPILVEKTPEAIPEEKKPEKEIAKLLPAQSVNTGSKTYSVQLMALKNPVEVDYFKDIEQVRLVQYPDGYYRYLVGNTSSYSEAQQLVARIHSLGYKDAFIRLDKSDITPSPSDSKYTIQLMALIIPVTSKYFKDLPSVAVMKGSDGYFRYTIGSFDLYQEAKLELEKIKSMGYQQAFIKKAN